MRNKSDENWQVGNQCLADGSLNAGANRLYYAVFQAVLDFAVAKQGYRNEGRGGVHAAMARVVRSQGKASEHYHGVFRSLMVLRETADYERETPDRAEIEALVEDSNTIRTWYLGKAEN